MPYDTSGRFTYPKWFPVQTFAVDKVWTDEDTEAMFQELLSHDDVLMLTGMRIGGYTNGIQ